MIVQTVVVTPQLLSSVHELPEDHAREVVKALRRLLSDPGDPTLQRKRSGGRAPAVESIRAGDSCVILLCGERVLFAGSDESALRFADRMRADATAFTEAPAAYLLRVDFWHSGSLATSESPSCGAHVTSDDLDGLLVRGRKYLPLAHLLSSRGPETGSVELSFREIETALGGPLPEQARTHPAWWADTRSNAQANAWLAVGWQLATLDLQNQSVRFVRTEPRA